MSANFRTSMFGGFNREDVISYIEKTARENQDRIQELMNSTEALQQENDDMRMNLNTLRQELDAMRQTAQNAQSVSEKYEALRVNAVKVAQRAEALEAENKDLRVQASEYQAMKDHIAEIEISAHKRTEEFRAAAIEQLHGVVAQQRTWFDQQRAQYTEFYEGLRSRLQAAQDALGSLDMSGFERADQEMTDLDRSLDE